MNQLGAIALNGFREASRNRVTTVVFAFAVVMILSSVFALEFTVSTFDRVMTDVGLGVMSLISAALTIFLGSGLIPREIERRTIFMVVSRPVSRSVFVVGRLLGNVLTVFAVLTVMAVLLAIVFKLSHYEFTSAMLVAIFGFYLEALLLTALTIFFSTWASQMVTVVATIGLYFVGHASADLYKLGAKGRAATEATRWVGRVLYYLFPNFGMFDYKPQATYAEVVPTSELLQALSYGVGYAVVLTAAACLVFERRDFK